MKTDDLIKALAADARTTAPPLERTLGLALLAGAGVSLLAFALLIGLRSDIAQALGTVRFVFKFVVILAVAMPAIAAVLRIGRPGARLGGWGPAIAVGPGLLALALAAELMTVPSEAWAARLVGSNAIHCLIVIPLLALAPLVALLAALRHGAPSRPGQAGALAGLAAASIAAAYYASNCTDDSPLFVATWYPLAFTIPIVAGSLLGPRLLRW
jgi:hypothetical protein